MIISNSPWSYDPSFPSPSEPCQHYHTLSSQILIYSLLFDHILEYHHSILSHTFRQTISHEIPRYCWDDRYRFPRCLFSAIRWRTCTFLVDYFVRAISFWLIKPIHSTHFFNFFFMIFNIFFPVALFFHRPLLYPVILKDNFGSRVVDFKFSCSLDRTNDVPS